MKLLMTVRLVIELNFPRRTTKSHCESNKPKIALYDKCYVSMSYTSIQLQELLTQVTLKIVYFKCVFDVRIHAHLKQLRNMKQQEKKRRGETEEREKNTKMADH